MSTKVYQLPVDKTGWQTADKSGTAMFTWDYDDGREKLINLYAKGKKKQWDAAERIDWSHDPDPENPLQVPDELVPIFGSPVWDKLTADERGNVRRHMVAWQFSQFLHGEQGALICTAKIVQTVPDIDSKYYAATQVMDEARHVETYSRYLDKIETAYPINGNLKSLLDDVLSDSRWDMTYLGMQILIEGLALAAFGLIRNIAGDPLGKAVNAYVMQDEARHVMFGRLALRDYYPQLTQAERNDREEFCADACYRMRDRFLGEELWQCLGYDADECIEYVKQSESQQLFRSPALHQDRADAQGHRPVGPEDACRRSRTWVSSATSRPTWKRSWPRTRRSPKRSTVPAATSMAAVAIGGSGQGGLTDGAPDHSGCQTGPVPVRSAARSAASGPPVGWLPPLPWWCSSPGASAPSDRLRGAPVRAGCPPRRPGPGPAAATTAPSLPIVPAQWTSCGELQCGSVTVPLDYADPDGPTLQIAVARHPAEVPAERIGSLVINPGGPGASGIDDLPNELSVLTPGLLDRFDIVSFDPRGVGRAVRSPARVAGHGHGFDPGGTGPGAPIDPVPTTPAPGRACSETTGRSPTSANMTAAPSSPRRHRRHRPGPRPDPGGPG